MMPSTADIFCCPFSDDTLWREQRDKATFWNAESFYGIDLRPLAGKAEKEYMSQAVVGYFGPEVLLSCDRAAHKIDFKTVTVPELQTFTVPLHFRITKTAVCHGLGCWFDAHFLGSDAHVTLSTAPDQPGTHW